MSETVSDENDSANLPVADRVLINYLRALGKDPSMKEAAVRMSAALLDGKPITEHLLRQALFEEPTE